MTFSNILSTSQVRTTQTAAWSGLLGNRTSSSRLLLLTCETNRAHRLWIITRPLVSLVCLALSSVSLVGLINRNCRLQRGCSPLSRVRWFGLLSLCSRLISEQVGLCMVLWPQAPRALLRMVAKAWLIILRVVIRLTVSIRNRLKKRCSTHSL